MARIRPSLRRMLAACIVLVPAFVSGPAGTMASFSSSSSGSVNTLAGAVFHPETMSAPQSQITDSGPLVEWSSVALSSGHPVTYSVTRTGNDGSVASVCPAVSQETVAPSSIRCIDGGGSVGVAYTYSVMPSLVRGGVTTWTRPASPASQAVTIPGVRYGDISVTSANGTGGTTQIPYPTGTRQGDILILVVRNAKKRQVKIQNDPTGRWSLLYVNESTPSGDSVHVMWSRADASTSVVVDLGLNGSEAAAAIVRYRPPANTSTVNTAHATVVSGQSNSPTTAIGLAALTTTAPHATAISIVSTVGTGAPGLSTSNSFVSRVSRVDTVAGVSFGLGVADRSAATSGASVNSPVWSLATSTKSWQAVTIAFS